MSDCAGILVIAEMAESGAARIGLELLGLAKGLAQEAGQTIAAVLLGSGLEAAAAELAKCGAATVYAVDSPELAEYNPDSYLVAILNLCEELHPAAILAGHTPMGQDLMPRLAFALTYPHLQSFESGFLRLKPRIELAVLLFELLHFSRQLRPFGLKAVQL